MFVPGEYLFYFIDKVGSCRYRCCVDHCRLLSRTQSFMNLLLWHAAFNSRLWLLWRCPLPGDGRSIVPCEVMINYEFMRSLTPYKKPVHSHVNVTVDEALQRRSSITFGINNFFNCLYMPGMLCAALYKGGFYRSKFII